MQFSVYGENILKIKSFINIFFFLAMLCEIDEMLASREN